jgi:predicted metal-dependent phosphoesterase TrpH
MSNNNRESYRAPSTYVDLHAHTSHSRFNEGVAHSPEELVKTAKERELGGIALTGHDTLGGLDNALEAAEKHGIILVPGVEIMTRKGLRVPHMVGLLPTNEALNLFENSSKLPRFKNPEYTADWIQDHGGVVIAPHTSPRGNRISLSYHEVEALGQRLDAIETHTTHGENPEVMALAEKNGISSVGSSDAHRLEEVGLVKTAVFGTCRTAEDVIEAIKEGRVSGFIKNTIPKELQGERDWRSIIRGYREKKRF